MDDAGETTGQVMDELRASSAETETDYNTGNAGDAGDTGETSDAGEAGDAQTDQAQADAGETGQAKPDDNAGETAPAAEPDRFEAFERQATEYQDAMATRMANFEETNSQLVKIIQNLQSAQTQTMQAPQQQDYPDSLQMDATEREALAKQRQYMTGELSARQDAMESRMADAAQKSETEMFAQKWGSNKEFGYDNICKAMTGPWKQLTEGKNITDQNFGAMLDMAAKAACHDLRDQRSESKRKEQAQGNINKKNAQAQADVLSNAQNPGRPAAGAGDEEIPMGTSTHRILMDAANNNPESFLYRGGS